MKTQKELKNLYAQELPKAWESQRMVDYCLKKAAYIVELDDGTLAEIDKPDIETRFCFGHGFCGVSTEEDEERACNMAAHARTSEEYFISENLEGLNRRIASLNEMLTDGYHDKVYHHPHYNGQTADCKLAGISFCEYYDTIPEYGKELTNGEILRLIEGYEEVKKAFTKRLHTYLKRYGLSKLHVWTYLSD